VADDCKAECGLPCLSSNGSVHIVGDSERKMYSGNQIYFS